MFGDGLSRIDELAALGVALMRITRNQFFWRTRAVCTTKLVPSLGQCCTPCCMLSLRAYLTKGSSTPGARIIDRAVGPARD